MGIFPLVDKPYYQVFCISLEVVAVLNMLIMLITTIGLPKYHDNKLRLIFRLCLTFGILSCLIDIWCYIIFNDASNIRLFRNLCELTTVLAIVFSALEAGVIIRYLSIKGKVNIVIRETIRILLTICIIAAAIPPVYDLIFSVTEYGTLELNILSYPYFIIMIIQGYLLMALIIQNRSSLGLKFALLTLFLRFMPTVIFVFIGDNQPLLMLSSSFFLLISYIIVYQDLFFSLIDKEKKLSEKKLELSDMKTKIILSQVKPHFIYNALSSISILCKKDAIKAQELILCFSDYLRNNLDTLSGEGVSLCSFETELEHIKCYLNIEMVRFANKLNIEYDIKATAFSVPALSIQPIVENAVKHGVCEKIKGGTVKIESRETDRGFFVTVTDNGVGFDINKIADDGKTHIGISATRKRIELISGELNIESQVGVGTKATVFIKKEGK